MKKPHFVNEEVYHIYNRGVEKRKVFMGKDDYFRFIHDLYEFNDEHAAPNLYYKLPSLKSYEVQPHKSHKIVKRKLLVEIIAFCLMPNHFHLLLRQFSTNGIIKFMQKLGTGYTMYFNQKYERVGALFQGSFKAALIDNNRYLLYLPHYIHLNPLDNVMPEWRAGKVRNKTELLRFLGSYRWSSYLDHTGIKNFPSLISARIFKEFYGKPEKYKESLYEWITDMQVRELRDILLE